MDATLAELTQLIKEVHSQARRRGTQFAFAIVSADQSDRHYYLREIGKTENGQRRIDDHFQLGHKRFQIGDYLDVAILSKRNDDDGKERNHPRERHSDGKIPRMTQGHHHHHHHPY